MVSHVLNLQIAYQVFAILTIIITKDFVVQKLVHMMVLLASTYFAIIFNVHRIATVFQTFATLLKALTYAIILVPHVQHTKYN
jgi:hypothetical protein